MLRHELRSIQNPDRRKLLQETLGLLEKSFGEELMSVVVFGSVARGEKTQTVIPTYWLWRETCLKA